MFWLIKQVFTLLLVFSGSLTTKFVSLSKEPCVRRTTCIDLSPVEFDF